MLAGGNLFQDLRDGGTWSSRGDHRAGADMHHIDHRDRCVGLGKCSGDSCECAWPEACTAELDRQHQPKKPGSPQRVNRLGREPTLLIVLPGGLRQHMIGYLSCFRKRCLMIHDAPLYIVSRGKASHKSDYQSTQGLNRATPKSLT